MVLAPQHALDIHQHLVGGLIPLLWFALHRPIHNGGGFGRQIRIELLGRAVLRALRQHHGFELRAGVEGATTGQHQVHERADRKNVGAGIEGPPQSLLGGHESYLPLDDARQSSFAFAVGLGDAKVGQLDLSLLADENVVRADVTMNDAERATIGSTLGVRIRQGPADLGGHVKRQRGGPRVVGTGGPRALKELLQVPTFHQLQHQKGAVPRNADVQDLDDVSVTQAHRNMSLVQEHVSKLRIGRKRGQHPFEHHRLLKSFGPVLHGQKDLGHSAVSQLTDDRIAAVRH